MVNWINIKRNELPSDLIPYSNFNDDLDLIIVSQSLMGWECDIAYADTNRDRRYSIQFDKPNKQVHIMIYIDKQGKFRSIRVDTLTPYGTDFYSDVVEHYGDIIEAKTKQQIKEVLETASKIMDLGNN